MKAIFTLPLYYGPLLLIAPPAWGKTSLLLNLGECYPTQKLVFISPLRALANEFSMRLKSENKRILNIVHFSDFTKIKSQEWDYLCITPELFMFMPLILCEDCLFVLDEFHLVYYWGDSFRDLMFMCYEKLATSTSKLLFLTATMSAENLERFKMEMSLNVDRYFILNLGNQSLKNLPAGLIYYPKIAKNLLLTNLKQDVFLSKDKGTLLLFCRYRNEVKYWVSYFNNQGHIALGCVGGEVARFGRELETSRAVDVIVATLVLGHGVNLPKISRIYFLYPVGNLDFWIQMAARGGRQGESFNVHSMDRYCISWKARYLWPYYCLRAWLTLIFALWMSRVFSFVKLIIRNET